MANDKRLCMGCMNEIETTGPCAICGFDELVEKNAPEYLPLHSLIANRYIVGSVIEANGEGVTYKGYDCNTDTPVRIREYFPANLSKRAEDNSVAPNIGDEGPFELGMAAFEELAKSLSHLNDLPALVPVTDLFKENGTVYYITESFVGISLREFLMRNNGALKWEQIKPLFLPIMSTVKALHSIGIIHMGISPETVMVCRDGRLRLVGFCIKEARTARNSINGQLYPGFAAVEQYGARGEQGPWTDVYGFAATIYRTLVGTPPMEATERVTNDNMTIPAKIAETLPRQVMVALANALEILPEDRTQTMMELRSELLASDSGQIPVVKPENSGKKSKNSKKKNRGVGVLYGLIAGLSTALVLMVAVFVFWDKVIGPLTTQDNSSNNNVITSSTVSIDPNIPCTVPTFLHMDYNQVMGYSEYTQNFNIEVVKFDYNDEGFANGEIYDQFPKGNEVVNKGATIQLYVSFGPSPVVMPDLIGKTYDEAVMILAELGFNPANIHKTEGIYPNVPVNTVYYQETSVKPDLEGKISPECEVYLRINTSENSVSSLPTTETVPVTSVVTP